MSIKALIINSVIGGLFLLVFGVIVAEATDYQSSGFIIRDPVINVGGARAASTDFEIFSSAGQTAIGEGASSGFTVRSGFLYYHVITAPALSGSPGDSKADLSWTAANEPLGKLTTSYAIGQSSNPGGPYSFGDVGNVTSFTQTGLTNGLTYYFVVQARDSSGNNLAQSNEVKIVLTAPGGGGGAGPPAVGAPPGVGNNTVAFSGRAYPLSPITLLKDAQIAASTVAGPDSKFQVTLGGLTSGSYIFGIYATDNKGDRSPIQTFPITLSNNATVFVSGIFIAPTIAVDKSEVRRGDDIAIFGQSTPDGTVTVAVNSPGEVFRTTQADGNGIYLYNFDSAPLVLGQHAARSKANLKQEVSPFGKTVGFLVGTKNVTAEPVGPCPQKADLNGDCRVNLVDFSIAAFWYKRPLSGEFRTLEISKLSGDGKVDLVDFSIMAFYWTG